MGHSLLLWNRLEGILRNENQIENALRFEVRDPIWMLTRQWQFGEFEGEDAGTAAFTRIATEHESISLAGKSGEQAQAFDMQENPLEMAVEFEDFEHDFAIRLEMGRHWRRLLRKYLSATKAAEVWQQFRMNRRFQFSEMEDGDVFHRFQNAQTLSDEKHLQALNLLKGGRAMDGYVLYRELKSGMSASLFMDTPDQVVDVIGDAFVAWFEKTYGQRLAASNTWHTQHMEYQPQFGFKGKNGALQVLHKEEYHGEGISWHGFTIRDKWDDNQTPTLPNDSRAESQITVIPTPVRFRGMPSTRLWEMEDAQVDFGSIRSASTELSKMLYAEFGLVYGNDVAPGSCWPSGRQP